MRVAAVKEQERIEKTAISGTGKPSEFIDVSEMMADVKSLADPGMEGRRVGTAGSKKAREYIISRFQETGVKPFGASFEQKFSFVHKSIKGFFLPGKPFKTAYPDATNLIATAEGKEKPRQYIVMSAHYDHEGVKQGKLYPGADDNASGVAAMLQSAEYFAKNPPRHTILFVAFDAEEVGLKGAKHFVETFQKTDAILLNVNLDMVSRADDGSIVIAGSNPYPQLRPIAQQAARAGAMKVTFAHDRPMYLAGEVSNWTTSSDHGEFHEKDIPFLYFGVEDHADYHRPSDTPDKINQENFRRSADLILRTLQLADQKL